MNTAARRHFHAAIKHLARAQRSLELAELREPELQHKLLGANDDLTAAANRVLDVAEREIGSTP